MSNRKYENDFTLKNNGIFYLTYIKNDKLNYKKFYKKTKKLYLI